MKNNLKENKGITLVALIITIIVLLILAVVTIAAVSEGEIFNHANNAATRYNAAAVEENTIITNHLGEMAKYDGGETPPPPPPPGEETGWYSATFGSLNQASVSDLDGDMYLFGFYDEYGHEGLYMLQRIYNETTKTANLVISLENNQRKQYDYDYSNSTWSGHDDSANPTGVSLSAGAVNIERIRPMTAEESAGSAAISFYVTNVGAQLLPSGRYGNIVSLTPTTAPTE